MQMRTKIITFFSAVMLESVLALVWLTRIPGDASAVFIFGMSLQRFLLATVPLLFFLLSAAILVAAIANPESIIRFSPSERQLENFRIHIPWLLWLAGSCLAFWLLSQHGLGLSSAVMQRLAPVLLLAFLLLIQTALFMLWLSGQQARLTWQMPLKTLLVFGVLMGILVGLSTLAGIEHALASGSYSGAGIPIFPKQLVVALYIACTYACLRAINRRNHVYQCILTLVTAVFLFSLAAWVWLNIPIPETHFTHASNLKEGEFILQSDASTYDLNARRMLMGLGLAAGEPLPRPLFSFFLAITHLLFGNEVHVAINAYSVLLGLVPLMIFFLAHRAGWPAAGVLAACLFIFREANQAQLSSTFILSNVRMLLSEPFTALFLTGLVLVAAAWLKHPSSRTWAALSGAVLGLAALIRTQVLILLPLLLGLGFLALRKRKQHFIKKGLWLLLGVLLGVLLVVLPWMSRNAVRSGSFTFDDPAYSALWELDTEQPSDISLLAAVLNEPLGYAAETWSYFSNNALSSLYQLPWQTGLADDVSTYQQAHATPPFYPAFRPSPPQVAALVIHLVLIVLGLCLAWQTLSWAGVLPAGVYLAYALSSSLARFSGWRFILPVDWIVLLYWSAGLVACFRLAAGRFGMPIEENRKQAKAHTSSEWPVVPLVAFILMLGLLMPLGESLFPRRILPLDRAGMLQRINASSAPAEIKHLASQPETHVTQGMLVFPVYLDNEQAFNRLKITEPDILSESPLVRFFLIMQDRTTLFLPVNKTPPDFPRDIPVITVSCQQESHLLTYGMLVDAEQPYWLPGSQPVPSDCMD